MLRNNFVFFLLFAIFLLSSCSLNNSSSINSSDSSLYSNKSPAINDSSLVNDSFVVNNSKDRVVSVINNTNVSFNSSFFNNSVNSSVSFLYGAVKLLPPYNNKIYFGAFPDFSGTEDFVNEDSIIDFESLAGRRLAWAYFSQNWFNGIVYPEKAVHTIASLGVIPFIRLMPRSSADEYVSEKKFTLKSIINGVFDPELRRWALDSKADFEKTRVPLLVDFGVEMNGDWFPWSGSMNGAGIKDSYGDPDYPDGPELYRDAYRHIIDLFRSLNVSHITWFFHPDIISNPSVWWNKPMFYYPGDDYIDWVGVSVYGPLTPDDDPILFSNKLAQNIDDFLEITRNKPLALLEFGVTDNHPSVSKASWLQDAFKTILGRGLINFSAVSYWNENWEDDDGLFATLRIDSSPLALSTFKSFITNPSFTSNLVFSNLDVSVVLKNLSSLRASKPENISWYHPKPGIKWFWQLSGTLRTDYDVDLYDVDLEETSKETIDYLHNKGIRVICYFNAGAYEPYRSDSADFPKEVLGKTMDGWDDEKWLDIASFDKFASIMRKRLDLAVNKGCDGVEPDNINSFEQDTGFPISYDDQLKYNKWLAREAHKRGLAIALKNDGSQVHDLVDDFDFAIVEECFEYDECSPFSEFINHGKAVLGVEYELSPREFCDKAKKMRFSWFKADYDLDGGMISCD